MYVDSYTVSGCWVGVDGPSCFDEWVRGCALKWPGYTGPGVSSGMGRRGAGSQSCCAGVLWIAAHLMTVVRFRPRQREIWNLTEEHAQICVAVVACKLTTGMLFPCVVRSPMLSLRMPTQVNMAPYLFFLGVGTYTTYRRWLECVHAGHDFSQSSFLKAVHDPPISRLARPKASLLLHGADTQVDSVSCWSC